jgi:hypothetical protein
MALTNNQKQEALRKRRAELGQKRREYYLTDAEKARVDAYVKRMRKEPSAPS